MSFSVFNTWINVLSHLFLYFSSLNFSSSLPLFLSLLSSHCYLSLSLSLLKNSLHLLHFLVGGASICWAGCRWSAALSWRKSTAFLTSATRPITSLFSSASAGGADPSPNPPSLPVDQSEQFLNSAQGRWPRFRWRPRTIRGSGWRQDLKSVSIHWCSLCSLVKLVTWSSYILGDILNTFQWRFILIIFIANLLIWKVVKGRRLLSGLTKKSGKSWH